MKLLQIACSVFNDKESFKRHLSSIPENIDETVYDGRYKEFDYPCDLSDDGTRELALDCPKVKLVDAGGLREVVKRQKYFDDFNPKKYKFLLAVDADEYIKGDWDEFYAELKKLYKLYGKYRKPICLGVNVNSPIHSAYDLRPRLWINAQDVYIGPKHFEYTNRKNNTALYPIYEVQSIKIQHDYKLRYPSYNTLREAYQLKLIATEGS